MSQSDHVQLRQSGYYLRYTLPSRYKCLLNRGELRYSLHTHKRIEARSRARRLVVQVESLLDSLLITGRYMALTDEQIQKLVKRYVDEARQLIEEAHVAANYQDRYEAERLADTIDGLMADKAEVLASSNFREIQDEVTQFLSKNGVDGVDPKSLAFKKSCREYLRGQVALYKYNAKLLRGGDTFNAVDYMRDGVKPEALAAPVSVKQARKLSELFPEFLKQRELIKGLSEGTSVAYRAAYDDLIEILGDVEVTTVKYDQAVRFRDTLLQLPKHRHTRREFKHLKLKQLLQLTITTDNLITPKTVNGKIATCITFFQWLVDTEEITRNPFHNIKVSTKHSAKSYDMYENEELQLIFSSPLYQVGHAFRDTANGKAAMWWLLPLLLFTGARAGELLQLRLADVSMVDGILTIHIKEDIEYGQKVKTAAGVRVVPVHPVLLKLGFEDYLKQLAGAGYGRVLEGFKLAKDKASRSATKWYGDVYRTRFLPDYFKATGKVLHSFRGTFVTVALNRDVSLRLVQQIVGHSDSKVSGATAIYDKGANVPQLFEAVKQLGFEGVDFLRMVDGWQGLKLK